MARRMTADEQQLWQRAMAPDASPPPLRVTERVPFSATLDLHGMTVQAAYEAVGGYLAAAQQRGIVTLRIITGLSGLIGAEFGHWMGENPAVRRLEMQRGGGAWVVILHPKPPKTVADVSKKR